MKIGIDARFVGPQGTGLGKYSEKLIENLAKIDSANNYVIFLRSNNWDFLTLPKNFTKVLADVLWYGVEEQIKLPKIFQSQKLDLLHVPHFNVPIFYRGKFIVTIHDLIHHQFKETSATTKNRLVFSLKRLSYKLIINSAVKRSQKIITPSNFVKTQMVKSFRVDPQKIIVTYEAPEEEYQKNIQHSTINNQRLLKKFSIKIPFLIYVGNAYPHKNLDSLLQALKILIFNSQFSTLNLVIACSRDVFYQRLKVKIEKLNLEKNVILSGYIPSKDLAKIFTQAEAYVFPTLSEGFGIPALNAMSAGLAVAAADIPTLREIYGDAALYFDPQNPQDIAEKLNLILSDPKTRSDLVKRGLGQAKKYSWQKMAEETLEVYKQAI